MTTTSKYVKIPFRAQFRESMLKDLKVCTSRTQPMGSPEQMFVAFGARFQLDEVQVVVLSDVCQMLYVQEGFESPEDFIATWVSIHPSKGYNPAETVYVHWFHRLSVLQKRVPPIVSREKPPEPPEKRKRRVRKGSKKKTDD